MGLYDTITLRCQVENPPVLPKWWVVGNFQTKHLGKLMSDYVISNAFGNQCILYRTNRLGAYIPSTFTGNIIMVDYQTDVTGTNSGFIEYKAGITNGTVDYIKFISFECR